MKSLQGACTVLLLFTLIFSNSFDSCAQGKCLNDQKALLLQLNQSLISVYRDPDHPFIFSSKRDSWRLNTDCCSWDGIGCDSSGRVISLDLSGEHLVGGLNSTSSLFSLQNLERLSLADNHFEVTSAPIPSGLDQLPNLNYLNMSESGFIGQIPIDISRLTSLVILDLSSVYYTQELHLIIKDPDLETLTRNLTGLRQLLLDSVRISERGNKWCRSLSSSLPNLQVLSLEGCELSGPLDSSLLRLQSLRVLRLSGNHISSVFPNLCHEATQLQVLDLSNNNLSGSIPPCLGSIESLTVLNLRGNNFHGIIPDTFPKTCNMIALDLNRNKLEGQLPRSLTNCKMLKVLDLGNNQLAGTFPYWLKSMSQLRVLVLRSNKFHGAWGNQGANYNFSALQIIDVSSNNFSGALSKDLFSSLKTMMVKEDKEAQGNQENQNSDNDTSYYHQTVTVTSEGLNLELMKVETIFTCIDFSNNEFEGEIPESIADLTSLRILNFSGNALTGPIPSTFGNLTNMESLDLSRNKLTGEIPSQLAALSFLSFLNLSFNNLEGKIPSGNQIQTFGPSSFEGNDGLCGFPLPKICSSSIIESPQN
ncbi:hypothetical protein C5167_025617 [Papaver somniferum]|uniref:Leucine-rich repeat-containing N-terminal plant-type domain-containing protein n=1 Tax=Papaver somniferum TaxID=3469 RepID=A0A4Y7JT81_PAPSO|nr:hypothetical protein C5167_025617 [Papaver somniferum]